MCLTVPGKILSVEDGDPAFRNAEVDFCGVRKTVNLAYTPDVAPGDFVLVHVGFAISRVDRRGSRTNPSGSEIDRRTRRARPRICSCMKWASPARFWKLFSKN